MSAAPALIANLVAALQPIPQVDHEGEYSLEAEPLDYFRSGAKSPAPAVTYLTATTENTVQMREAAAAWHEGMTDYARLRMARPVDDNDGWHLFNAGIVDGMAHLAGEDVPETVRDSLVACIAAVCARAPDLAARASLDGCTVRGALSVGGTALRVAVSEDTWEADGFRAYAATLDRVPESASALRCIGGLRAISTLADSALYADCCFDTSGKVVDMALAITPPNDDALPHWRDALQHLAPRIAAEVSPSTEEDDLFAPVRWFGARGRHNRPRSYRMNLALGAPDDGNQVAVVLSRFLHFRHHIGSVVLLAPGSANPPIDIPVARVTDP